MFPSLHGSAEEWGNAPRERAGGDDGLVGMQGKEAPESERKEACALWNPVEA